MSKGEERNRCCMGAVGGCFSWCVCLLYIDISWVNVAEDLLVLSRRQEGVRLCP